MENKNGIGRLGLTALIVSSCIGTGIFGITNTVAAAAAPGPALLSWVFVGIGFLLLVLSLNNLSEKRPDLEAGIFSYAGAGFGPLGEFISGWAYWLSAWLGNVAFATMLMSAIGTFIPTFKGGQNMPSIILAIIFCWALTLLVNRGVESASFVNTIGTFFKVIPLFLFIIITIIFFKGHMFTTDFWGNVANNFSKGTVTGSVFDQLKGTLSTLIWVFIGVEGASVMGHRAKTRSQAQQATIIGFIMLLAIYVMISIIPYGTLTRAQLASASQPALGNDLELIVGHWGAMIINIGLIISTVISWLSWTMLPAETTMLIAKDKVMPSLWGRLNEKNAPTASLYITAILQTIFLFSLLFTSEAYNFAYSLASAAILFSYLFVGLYQMKYSHKHQEWGQFTIGLLSALFMLACMFLSGWQQMLLVSISFIPGFIIYYQAVREDHRDLGGKEKAVMGLILLLSVVAIYLVANGTIVVA
ncbi:basic amino acid/polyamine antiporter [Pediococcus acidilactici]|uniref:basic amino acid/polyamine antiporter n=1 Tax=Pediococcus acidilactici TaxID=1254 RepID=UPI00032704C8|nr:basic amino acid/polyamine antiporter [Pediococcus acidilactici]EOA08287.1 arginine-ornithine antiporter, arcD [Pediococcus acidilactici D3]MBW4797698.1 amino acid permease [Pediococcus acidilactici]MBW9306340.1 amino acid permease [Pediococcus acidilactici]MCE5961869.1 basic amino acid/polyamine antiporter [Pediococcus acidilactici]MCW8083121.1 basic amino acid/polyamine antiporter [Pediococcus acidilactici]